MRSFFQWNNPVFGFLSGITNLIILNLLWMVCCIPVVTIVPATAAMYYVTLKMVRKEDPYILRSFFHSFRQNLKQGVALSVIFLLLLGLLYVDAQVLQKRSSEFHQVLLIVSHVISALVFMTFSYVCPFLSRFENTVSATLKNALIIGLSHPLQSVMILAIHLSPLVLLLFWPEYFSVTMLFWLLLGFALIALVNSLLLSKIFAKYEGKDPAGE